MGCNSVQPDLLEVDQVDKYDTASAVNYEQLGSPVGFSSRLASDRN